MINFMQMRQNMIAGQFLPGLIKNKKIIEFFGNTPRELFLPDQYQSLAYSDLNIKISNNRYVPSPFNTAKIFQEAELKGSEMILLIGANLGYEAAILSKLVDTVVAIEENIDMKKKADANIKKVNAENVLLLNSNHRLGHEQLGPYDLIISLEPQNFIESTLLDQLSEGGKFFYCEKQNINLNEGKLNVYYKEGSRYIKRQLFDLNIPSIKENTIHENKFNFC
jgi:protein-L-isoaspartate(D-aspartate) O-methyltransferase